VSVLGTPESSLPTTAQPAPDAEAKVAAAVDTLRAVIAPPSDLWRLLSSPPRSAKLPRGLDAAWNAGVSMVVPMVPRRGFFLRRAARIVALEPRYLH
jgi:hypothetical protein